MFGKQDPPNEFHILFHTVIGFLFLAIRMNSADLCVLTQHICWKNLCQVCSGLSKLVAQAMGAKLAGCRLHPFTRCDSFAKNRMVTEFPQFKNATSIFSYSQSVAASDKAGLAFLKFTSNCRCVWQRCSVQLFFHHHACRL